jgi:glycosyltransferase involved in cell wall biosynthesis
MNNIRVAIVHDWLTGMRGGEKCLEVFAELFPDATLFTLVHKRGSVSPTIEKMDIRTSFLERFPGVEKKYRSYLPLFPLAVESFDLSGYDLVLSSSHCVAKGVKSLPGALHICYCYTPVRYAWKFYDEYFGREKGPKKWLIARVIDRLRKWDLASNKRIDHFIAISDNVKSRISEYYGRDSDIIYPPVDVEAHGKTSSGTAPEGYYLIVSALVPYKRVDLAVEAFNSSGRELVVIGTGSDLEALKQRSGKNIEFKGWAGDEQLNAYYSGCRALIFPGEEDFGIVPVEAQLYGKPVIAYARGGALETIVPFREGHANDGASGVFFDSQTPEALNKAVEAFEKNQDAFNSDRIRENAMRFNRDRFKREIKEYIDGKWKAHCQG